MKKLISQGLIAVSVMMYLGCDDPVSEDSGTAPQILNISAEKTEFTVNSEDISSTENTTIALKIKDAEKNLAKIRMINMGQVQDIPWTEGMSNTEVETLLWMEIPVGVEQTIPVSYIAIDSKGNESDTSKLTFTVGEANLSKSSELKVVNNSDSKITFHFNGNQYPLAPQAETSLKSNTSNSSDFINDIYSYTTAYEMPDYVNDLEPKTSLTVEVSDLSGKLDFSQSGQNITLKYNSTLVKTDEYDTLFTNADNTSWSKIDTSSSARYSIEAVSSPSLTD